MEIKNFANGKIRVVENFIPKETCDYIVNYANDLDIWKLSNANPDMYPNVEDYKAISSQWDNRKIDFSMLYREKLYPELFKVIWDNQQRAKEHVLDFFNLNKEDITIECLEIIRWFYPYQQNPHIDYLDETFTPSQFPEGYTMEQEMVDQYMRYFTTKHFTTMMYLNDNFTGGEIFFPHENLEIKPKPGMLVLFSGDASLPHGVRQITEGTRYVNTTFWAKTPFTDYLLAHDDTKNILDRYWE